MDLLIVRHAHAEERESFAKSGKEDHLRPLVQKGRQRLEKMLEAIAPSAGSFEMVVTSPYLRAKQSAVIIASKLKCPDIIECAELVPQGPPVAFLKWLKVHAKQINKVVAVGHEPQLSALTSLLLTGSEDPILEFKKAGACLLSGPGKEQLSPRQFQLRWHLSPKLFE